MTFCFLLTAQKLVAFLQSSHFSTFHFNSYYVSHPKCLINWLMYSRGDLPRLFFPSIDPSIILLSKLLCCSVCPISLALPIFRAFVVTLCGINEIGLKFYLAVSEFQWYVVEIYKPRIYFIDDFCLNVGSANISTVVDNWVE